VLVSVFVAGARLGKSLNVKFNGICFIL